MATSGFGGPVSDGFLEAFTPGGPLYPLIKVVRSGPKKGLDVELIRTPAGVDSARFYAGGWLALTLHGRGGGFDFSAKRRTWVSGDERKKEWRWLPTRARSELPASQLREVKNRLRWAPRSATREEKNLEGGVQARLRWAEEFTLIARQPAFRQKTVVDRIEKQVRGELVKLRAAGESWAPKKPGKKAFRRVPDGLAVDGKGRLLVLEAKYSGGEVPPLQSVALAPAQVAVTAALARRWAAQKMAEPCIRGLLAQRAELELGKRRRLRSGGPTDVVGVIVLGGGIGDELLERMRIVKSALPEDGRNHLNSQIELWHESTTRGGYPRYTQFGI